jgi:DNA transposition AAA+ family ATPase
MRMLECLRDIHDAAMVPVMLVGMEGFEDKVRSRPQFYGRISQKVEFSPLNLEDTALVAASLCEVSIAPDLLEQIHKETKGSIRLIVVALCRLETFAKGNRITTLDAAGWGRKGTLAGVA